MKKIISLLIVIKILISFFGVYPAFAFEEEVIYAHSFEEEELLTWGTYYTDKHKEGVLSYSLNTDPLYASDGKQSFYLLDRTKEYYTGINIPKKAIPKDKRGEYTLSFDAYVITGAISVQLRFYTTNSSSVYQKKVINVNQNDGFCNYSLKFQTPVQTLYTAATIVTQKGTEAEAYVDNIKFIRTGDFDEEFAIKKEKLENDVKNAKAGDVIMVEDGEYVDFPITFTASGTEDEPIILKARNPGNAVFKDSSYITAATSNIIIDGLRFEECTYDYVVKFDLTSYNCQVRNCVIYNSSAKNWIYLRGRKSTVSNCVFDTKETIGQMVAISKSEETEHIPDEHIIENCYFGNIKEQSENGYEAIRIGLSGQCFAKSNTLVTGCFFYRCNGEVETISVKSCFNTVRNNTFYNNKGGIVLRHGDDNDVYGNLFIGGDKTSRVTGVRVIGERHKVHDNYFYNMPSNSKTMILFNGCPYEGILDEWYYPVVDAEVYNNTFIGGNQALQVGDYNPNSTNLSQNRTVAPDGKVYNNAIYSATGSSSLLYNGDNKHTVEFSNNYAYGKSIGYMPEGVKNEHFGFVRDGDYLKPEIEGIGADLNEVKKAPVNPFEIVPEWAKEIYFGTDLIKFSYVPHDPFNCGSHVSEILPFEVTYSIKSGKGILKAYKDGIELTGSKITVTNNPELEFVATPSEEGYVPFIYVNGERNETDRLIVTDITKNYNIQVEFKASSTVKIGSRSATVYNDDYSGNVIVAVFGNDNKLVSVTGYTPQTEIIIEKEDEWDYARVFWWDSFSGIHPLDNSRTVFKYGNVISGGVGGGHSRPASGGGAGGSSGVN